MFTDKSKLQQVEVSNHGPGQSWTQNLVEENNELKQRIDLMTQENQELVKECSFLQDRLEAKESCEKGGRAFGVSGLKIVSKENVEEPIDVKKESVDVKEGKVVAVDVVDFGDAEEEDEVEDGVKERLEVKSSFVRRLVEENEDLRKKLKLVSIENEELAQECNILAEGMKWKAKEVMILEDHIAELEEYVKGKKNENILMTVRDECGSEGEEVEEGSTATMTEDNIALFDLDEEEFDTPEQERGLVEPCDDEDFVALKEDCQGGIINKNVIAKEDNYDEIKVSETSGIAEQDDEKSEDVVEDKALRLHAWVNVIEEENEDEIGSKDDSDVQSLIPESTGFEGGSGKETNAKEVTNAPSTEEMVGLLKKIWLHLKDGIDDDGKQDYFDENPISVVDGLISKLKKENEDLRLEKSDMKELIEFLELERQCTVEELEESRTAKAMLEKENKAIMKRCTDLEEACQVLEDKCQNSEDMSLGIPENGAFDEKCQKIEQMCQNFEERCIQAGEEYSKLQDEYQTLQDENKALMLKLDDQKQATMQLESNATIWSNLCGKLYLFLSKDNKELEKLEDRCQKLGRLATAEQGRRRKLAAKLNMFKNGSQFYQRRRNGVKVFNALGGKNLDLQIKIGELQSEIAGLKEDRDGFETAFKEEMGLNVRLRTEMDGLQSCLQFCEESLTAKREKIEEMVGERRIALEQLKSVREGERDSKRRMEKLEKELAERTQNMKDMMVHCEQVGLDLLECKRDKGTLEEKLQHELRRTTLLESDLNGEIKLREAYEKKVRTMFEELEETKHCLSNAASRLEESQNTIMTLQKMVEERSRPKQSRLRRWFRRQRRNDG